MYCNYKCSVALPRGAVGWSAVCDVLIILTCCFIPWRQNHAYRTIEFFTAGLITKTIGSTPGSALEVVKMYTKCVLSSSLDHFLDHFLLRQLFIIRCMSWNRPRVATVVQKLSDHILCASYFWITFRVVNGCHQPHKTHEYWGKYRDLLCLGPLLEIKHAYFSHDWHIGTLGRLSDDSFDWQSSTSVKYHGQIAKIRGYVYNLCKW